MSSEKVGDTYQLMNRPKPVRVGGPKAADMKFRSTVHIVPDTAACEGTTTVTLVFDEFPESLGSGSGGGGGGGLVEVSVRSKEKTSRIVARQINRRTFSFTAPENREGDASAVVFVNGAEVASCYLHYRSDTIHLVAGLSQIYLQFLGTVCRYMYTLQTKHQIPSPIPELDRLLAESLEDRDNRIPPKAFEELFDIYRHSSTDVIESKYEFPTLLHLTGEYGLEQLSIRLLDLPGASRANNILNHKRRTAVELARNNGHHPVAKTLGKSSQVKNSPVEKRVPIVTPAGPTRCRDTLMPKNPSRPNDGGDYMLPDGLDNASPASADFEDNYHILSKLELSSTCNTSATGTPRKPPPGPCQKFIQSKPVPTIFPESQYDLPRLQPRSSEETAAPPVPRRESRESRDSGVNVDSNDAPGPPQAPPTARKTRPPLLKRDTEPAFVYSDDGHYVPIRKASQDMTGNTVQRNLSIPGDEIARQLRKQVLPQPGARGPSVTK